ncbi:glycosyltransferase family 2 protein [Olleya sp. YSTF-M6]|uniref:Glycosyltransferase family 2 protein n=1 Tax=Olleya sediminilitoris TaxID=2795739 RepID=A0ABS1WKQ5_9FLAO|nr:glycosyltransferase family A protein [Olleya sediminilitoris]MBL7559700.1 glycosyltransferase family 2 protein [Olleya sediminilitoris]
MHHQQFAILITTRNRLEDLKITLGEISYLLNNENVACIICDDGSTDGTFQYLKDNYKQIQVIQNKTSKGLIFSRNRLLNLTTAAYAITLDDDAHIVTNNPLEIIDDFFINNSQCAVIAGRIFWGKDLPCNLADASSSTRVKSFVGCGHVWRMDAWRSIPNYPDWFVFYGEEEFASFQLFKNEWEVWYVPALFIQHRVDVKSRKKKKDYTTRLRRSLRSGWYLYFMFYPLHLIPKKFLYTLWMQLRLKVFKGDFKALKAIILALFDLIINLPKCININSRLSLNEYQKIEELKNSKIYWKPKEV